MPDDLPALHARMRAAAQRLRFPSARTWKGQTGNWSGTGTGSSIDFQDHRQYVPGDDPRYINWQAYGRTGQYTMKLYREEISPTFEIILDASPSMFLHPEKATRALELLYFSIENALAAGTAPRVHWMDGTESPIPLAPAQLLSHSLPPAGTSRETALPLAAQLARVPRKPGSMRVLISDLLTPESPAALLALLTEGKARPILLAPQAAEETDPQWGRDGGSIEFLDCETPLTRWQKAPPELVVRYKTAYARHFGMWREESRRRGVNFAQVPAAPPFDQALHTEAARSGAVEIVG